MLKVWRGKHHRLFAECTSCGSYGTAGHLQLKQKLSPEIMGAVEKHTAHMMALRNSYHKAVGPIAEQVRNGSMKRADGAAKIRAIWENHTAQVQVAVRLLPSPDGKVFDLATKCPWCNVEEEVEVEQLPEDQHEPDYELAKPVKEFLAARLEEERKREAETPKQLTKAEG